MSTDTWEIHTFGSGEYLYNIFNGIASILNSGNYSTAMQAVTLLAFLGLLLKSAFERELFFSMRWFIALMFFVFTAFSARVTVTLHDHIDAENSRTVSNVPFGIAFPASFFSSMGYFLTQAFETTFSLPNGLRYTQTGFLFSHSLLDLVQKQTFSDERLHQNFSEFFASCVIVDGVGHGRFTWQDVMEAKDLSSFFSDKVAQHAASFKYTHKLSGRKGKKDEYYGCREGFKLLKNDFSQDQKTTLKNLLNRLTPAKKQETTNQALKETISKFAGVKQTPDTMIQQSLLINGIGNGLIHFAQDVKAQAFLQNYIALRAESERKTTYQAVGKFAKEKLPILQSIIESFIYAIAPVILLLALIAPVKVSLTYMKALIWINLWPVCYAIIHFAISFHTAKQLKLLDINGGISAIQQGYMIEHLSEWVSTSGYLVSSLPLITWMILSASGSLAASFTNRIMQGYDSSVAKASDEVTKGEGQFSGHNWSMTDDGQIQTSSINNIGSKVTQTASGQGFVEQMGSKSEVGLNLSESLVQNSKQELASAQQYQESQSSMMQQSTSTALNNASSVMSSLNSSYGYSEHYQNAESQQQQENSRILDNSIEKWSKSQSDTSSNTRELSNDIKAKLSTDIGAGFSIFGTGAHLNLEGSYTANQKDTHKYDTSHTSQLTDDFVRSKEYANAVQSIASNTMQFAAEQGYSAQQSDMQNLSTSLTEQKSAISSYSEAIQHTESARESLDQVQSIAKTLSVNGIDTLKTIAQENGMSLSQFDQTLHRASHNDAYAIEEIKFLVTHAEMTGKIDEMDAREHMKEIENTYSNDINSNKINDTFTQWQQKNDSNIEQSNLDTAFSTVKDDVTNNIKHKNIERVN